MRQQTLSQQQIFNKVITPKLPRSVFPRPYFWSGTFNGDDLNCLFWDEVLPNDTHELSVRSLIRYNTLIKPIQAVQRMKAFFFFVPTRLVWTNFKRFMGERPNPGDSIDFLFPQVIAPETGFPENSYMDQIGVATKVNQLAVRADIYRSINLTINRWFRDQQLQDSLPVPMDDGPDDFADYSSYGPDENRLLFRHNKKKDYFTSGLPSPQLGPAVSIPLGTTAPLIGTSLVTMVPGAAPGINQQFRKDSNNGTYGFTGAIRQVGTSTGVLQAETSSGTWENGYINPNGSWQVDLSSGEADLSVATAANINLLRQQNMLQVFLENDNSGGTRYNELTYKHFGIMSEDARVQDPELIGVLSSDVNVTAIQQTGESGTTPQGNLAAMGTIQMSGKAFTKSFSEHGILLGFFTVETDQMYQQGTHRSHFRRTRYDFYWPEFAHLGEQAVLNREWYTQGPTVLDGDEIVDEQTALYQQRYSEYKYRENQVSGLYRSNATLSLDNWHLAQNFADLPVLGPDFIEENNPYDRVVAVTDQPDFNGQFWFDLRSTRVMPITPQPSLMDRL